MNQLEFEHEGEKFRIQAYKTVWIAWSNTDCTEGRGRVYAYAVCDMEATARRLGKGKSVQGSNCYVTSDIAVRIDGRWLVPGIIHPPKDQDLKQQKKLDAVNEAVKKAEALGLTAEEINLLMYKKSVS